MTDRQAGRVECITVHPNPERDPAAGTGTPYGEATDFGWQSGGTFRWQLFDAGALTSVPPPVR